MCIRDRTYTYPYTSQKFKKLLSNLRELSLQTAYDSFNYEVDNAPDIFYRKMCIRDRLIALLVAPPASSSVLTAGVRCTATIVRREIPLDVYKRQFWHT